MIVESQEVLGIKKVLGKSATRFLPLSLVTTGSIICRSAYPISEQKIIG